MEKILTFIVKDHKLLLLLGNDTDPQFHKSFWYVVTGACEEEDYSLKDTVVREVMEETGLKLSNIIDLNWEFNYESLGKNCVEHAFISYTDYDDVILNEENKTYIWCELDEFIERIHWFYDKKELKEKIEKYI